jgi:hypothetical protein
MNTEDHATLAAIIRGVDATAREHEREWGSDRLFDLIDDELRAKFYRQQAKWSAAIEAAYETGACPLTPAELETVQTLSEGLRRGWAAMAEQAAENGARAIRPEIWEMTLADGSKAALVRSSAEASVIDCVPERYVSIWTLDEIVNVIAINLPASIAEAKTAWPKTVILKGPKWNPQGDEIPFGSDDGQVEDNAEAFGKINIAPVVVTPRGPIDLEAEFG